MKHLHGITLFFVVFCGSGLFAHLWEREDDLSVRYILWKAGLWSKPDHLIWSLIADRGGPLHNMSKDEVKELFPDAHEYAAHEPGKRHEFEKHYMQDTRGAEHLWLCPYDVIAIYENGEFKYLLLAKG